ncbi:hypothetical protein EOT10_40220 [Streptomyces antnestii]|uniref:Uncharacterized protein n=1 Tax=Streptomyces antnestii TaxID=2494256 RepID=A0A437NY16_9ACTN|nr:hypothetical protein EOT10_40220 [Streptomyces sp. San01]
MDPISIALLAALAGGFGGEAGRQVWVSLRDLVRRPLNRSDGAPALPAVSSGEVELTALVQAPDETEHAQALSTALAVRAAVDPDFASALGTWAEQAHRVDAMRSGVSNEISGGTQYGPVLQGLNYSQLTFNAAPAPADQGGAVEGLDSEGEQ